VFGLEQATNAPASRAHWNDAPASEVKLKPARVCWSGFAGEAVMVTVGADVSIVHVNDAAAPVFPAASVALTWNVCEPGASEP